MAENKFKMKTPNKTPNKMPKETPKEKTPKLKLKTYRFEITLISPLLMNRIVDNNYNLKGGIT